MTTPVEVQELSMRLSELLALAQQGTDIIIAEESRPIARLTGINAARPQRIAGLHLGAAVISEDFDAPLPDEFWAKSQL